MSDYTGHKGNLAKWIPLEADGEEIEAVVIGRPSGVGDHYRAQSEYWKNPTPRLLSWEDARPILDYDFDSGYGGVGCHAITAWTKSRVIFVSQYDGATNICSVPRHPILHDPDMPGG